MTTHFLAYSYEKSMLSASISLVPLNVKNGIWGQIFALTTNSYNLGRNCNLDFLDCIGNYVSNKNFYSKHDVI